jgi:hypothetical protein
MNEQMRPASTPVAMEVKDRLVAAADRLAPQYHHVLAEFADELAAQHPAPQRRQRCGLRLVKG